MPARVIVTDNLVTNLQGITSLLVAGGWVGLTVTCYAEEGPVNFLVANSNSSSPSPSLSGGWSLTSSNSYQL